MKERGILFTPENYAKCAAGTKTQARRIAKLNHAGRVGLAGRNWHLGDPNAVKACPYGYPGDLLYVKEGLQKSPGGLAQYRREPMSTIGWAKWKWKRPTLSALHMPKDFARLWLELTEVRVERIQQIRYDDEGAEGVTLGPECNDRHSGFIALWESINGAGSWASNHYVWVLEFKKL